MKDVFTIMKKELVRFLTDKRMLLTLFMPGVLIYVMYSLMGTAMSNMFETDDTHTPVVFTVNASDSLNTLLDSIGAAVMPVTDIEEAKKCITDGTADTLIVLSENFDTLVQNYDVSLGKAPDVQIFYNSAAQNSSAVYSTVLAAFDAYEGAMVNKFDINFDAEIQYDLASEEDIAAMFYSSLMPMLLLMLAFTGSAAVAPEAIAGEKERGTMATMLITPVSRTKIALGKIFALSIIAIVSGASSVIGTLLAMPKLMAGSGADFSSVYALGDYVMISFVILTSVVLIITVMSILSTYAKTTKEAQMLSTPIMMVAIAVGVLSMLGTSGGENSLITYAIPLYNSCLCIGEIFSLSANSTFVIISGVSNLLYAAIGVFILTKMFDSEKVMFRI